MRRSVLGILKKCGGCERIIRFLEENGLSWVTMDDIYNAEGDYKGLIPFMKGITAIKNPEGGDYLYATPIDEPDFDNEYFMMPTHEIYNIVTTDSVTTFEILPIDEPQNVVHINGCMRFKNGNIVRVVVPGYDISIHRSFCDNVHGFCINENGADILKIPRSYRR